MRRLGICAVTFTVILAAACGDSDGTSIGGGEDGGSPDGSTTSSGDADVSDADVSDAGADADDAGDADVSCPMVNPCTVGAVVDGACVQSPVDDGTACDDGNACNGVDSCQAGTCTPAHPGTVGDDFEGNALDATKWKTNTAIPQGNASVVQSGGVVTLANRGYLVSAKPFDPKQGGLRVTAEWAFTSSDLDFVSILTRSDGTPGGDHSETNEGIECSLSSAGQLSVRKREASVGSGIVEASDALLFAMNEEVILEMFDDGTNVTCTARRELDNARVSVTSAFTTTFAKNHVVIHNRENADGTHTGDLDNITIEGGVSKRPFAQWTFDEAITSTALDWAGPYDGSFGSTAQRVSRASFGGAASVVGDANSYFDFGGALGALGTKNFSLAFWMKAPTPSGVYDFLGNRDSSSNGHYLGIRITETGTLNAEASGLEVAGGNLVSTVVGDGTWHHVVLRRNGETLTWFVDGAQVATGQIDGVPNISSTKHFLFGKSPFSNIYTTYATGSIDDLRLYDYDLQSCEVRNIYGTP
ncbi:hypothetical protein AKJ09_05847 [Labilithrix luteola]|uniref:Laminin G domain-containing protein n=1 Tax=Labilithrix luteola TaxID=1391654 RepID=A0A0K1Q079_9BACT|nr:LamG domain-containing protein [Labilithrix luteola]AKU99183.1 hypothetical protein AKJ09_05847 [Labilithrix luteola]